ncbi:MAG TPA: hypothetical protein VK499_05000 [Propionibacteriaceae bacterium]|nr:hypothetical protein [Propionibacteriaceae bacterium]
MLSSELLGYSAAARVLIINPDDFERRRVPGDRQRLESSSHRS